MARPRKSQHYIPTPQEMARFGIDTMSFTIPRVLNISLNEFDTLSYNYDHQRNEDTEFIQEFLHTFISPDLDLINFQHVGGNGFYARCISYSETVEDQHEFISLTDDPEPFDFKGKPSKLICISYLPRAAAPGKLYENKTTHFHLTGQLLKKINYIPLLKWILEQGGQVTKLHLFKDEFDRVLDTDTMYSLSTRDVWQNFIKSPLVHTYDDIYAGESSIYYGSKKYIQVHIYNKALEQHEKFHHVRVEVKLSKMTKVLTGIIQQIAEKPDQECQIISSLIGKYLNFLPKDANNRRVRHRVQPFKWWSTFLGSTAPVKIKDFLPPSKPVPLTENQKSIQRGKLLKKQADIEHKLFLLDFIEPPPPNSNIW